ncbi:hypothetical protein H310_08869 [Aphanomyces invadans]|uniref:Amine oxidase n=1 Tax=Aphanomyces invadans TaxID=157072 RepID=A0A024TVC1_9STRA|nr:hypothetical protein H310_08869 [Aphanomyces invadans]ETV98125.1 hypothetical protein H310_08869 [Aphanomyces invadans]|eukprot:XP_008873000.1 hypothetical protein H310_08869 [Aphanomyces invadans]
MRLAAATMTMALVSLEALCTSCTPLAKSIQTPPKFPLHFEADLEITAHLLDPAVAYPPSLRRMKIRYDYSQGLARADILAGFDKGKSYIRRYDTKKEYKVKYGKYANCERAYLGETMPRPELPPGLEFKGNENVRGQACERWTYDIPNTVLRVIVYNSVHSHVPIRLTQESQTDVGDWAPIITYDLLNIKLRPQDRSSFDIPGGYTHETCTRSVVGFPYIHVFDQYVRF